MRIIILNLVLFFVILFLSCAPKTEKEFWTESTFEDFIDGALDAGGNLHVTAGGTVRVSYSPDLNNDGWPDIIFSNGGSNEVDHTKGAFFIYWGGPEGFSAERRTLLPQFRSHSASIGDLDNDGYLDLVINGATVEENVRKVFTIFPGSENGFTPENTREIELANAFASAVADLDKSGYLDIVIGGSPEDGKRGLNVLFDPLGPSPSREFLDAGLTDFPTIADLNADNQLDIIATTFRDAEGNSRTNSFIFWNDGGRFSSDNFTTLPSYGGHGSAVADLNADGFLEVIINNFGNYQDDYVTPSAIFRGSSEGFDPDRSTELMTMGACECSAADLNGDGHLDLFFANWAGNEGFEGPLVPSYIYWGSPNGYSEDNRTDLPSVNGVGSSILDLNKDSFLDIVINNTGGELSSVYWGGQEGYSEENRLELESFAVFPTNMRDFGNIYNRTFSDTYVSSVFDAEAEVRWLSCSWQVETQFGDSVEIQLRAGLTPNPDDNWGKWTSVENGTPISDSVVGRYTQYRAIFNYGNFSRPALSEVRIEYSISQ